MIGKVITYYREQKGLTKTQLANELKVSLPTVSLWESGRRNPTDENLQLISNALGISISTLIEKSEEYSKTDEYARSNSELLFSENERLRIETERLRKRLYTMHDVGLELAKDVLVGIDVKVFDINYDAFHKQYPMKRNRHKSAMSALLENVIRDVLIENIDDIKYRIERYLESEEVSIEKLLNDINDRYYY